MDPGGHAVARWRRGDANQSGRGEGSDGGGGLVCGEWCGESTRPVRAPSAAAGLGTCTCQRTQREARGRAAAVCGVGGVSDSRRSVGRAPGGVEHGRWGRHAGGVVGPARARCGSGGRAPGQAVPGRCGPHQRSAPSPRRHTADRHVFKLPGWRMRQPCVGSSAAARDVSATMPSTPARADTSARDGMVAAGSGRMRPVPGGRDGPGRRSCGCGRSRVAARPRPADPSSRRHAARAPPRHGSWPSCTPCPAAGRAVGAGLGDGNSGWQALAGGRRAWWRRDGAGAG